MKVCVVSSPAVCCVHRSGGLVESQASGLCSGVCSGQWTVGSAAAVCGVSARPGSHCARVWRLTPLGAQCSRERETPHFQPTNAAAPLDSTRLHSTPAAAAAQHSHTATATASTVHSTVSPRRRCPPRPYPLTRHCCSALHSIPSWWPRLPPLHRTAPPVPPAASCPFVLDAPTQPCFASFGPRPPVLGAVTRVR